MRFLSRFRELPAYVKNHIIIACFISIAAYAVVRWAGFPFPFLALPAGGLFYVWREWRTSGLTMPDGSRKDDWTYPLGVTLGMTAAGAVAQFGGLL